MTLTEKIQQLYPELPNEPWVRHGIVLQNDSDGRGDYIAEWNHPEYPEPTQEELDGVK